MPLLRVDYIELIEDRLRVAFVDVSKALKAIGKRPDCPQTRPRAARIPVLRGEQQAPFWTETPPTASACWNSLFSCETRVDWRFFSMPCASFELSLLMCWWRCADPHEQYFSSNAVTNSSPDLASKCQPSFSVLILFAAPISMQSLKRMRWRPSDASPVPDGTKPFSGA